MGGRIMKKVLITGGAGTVGSAFIRKFYNDYEFYNISRNETQIAELQRNFPKVKSFLGNICDLDTMINIFETVKPDIVIHAAALKHINLAEENAATAVEINVLGSLNIIKASIRSSVPLTVGISTDKACDPDSVYGYTKRMMEHMFFQHHNQTTKFVCTRFANVAHSNGSVIPFWLSEAANGNVLKLTDVRMNRLMFSKSDAADVISKAINYATDTTDESFILCRKMKNVKMSELIKLISGKFEIIGKRPGEKLNEVLVSDKELKRTLVNGNDILIFDSEITGSNLDKEFSSLTAECMTLNEMENLLWQK